MAEGQKEQNPLLAALPPATDYLTYLTIVEYNLTEENLPVLHQVLLTTDLTVNIGWDLVHLLLPLLPASEECLQDIAAKGNPREVILKVTEALRLLEFEEPHEDSDEEAAPLEEGSSSKVPAVEVGESSTSPALPPTVLPPLPVLKFEILVDLLMALHRRVKTKYPSRFLSTSLQAVLVAYNRARTHRDELTLSAVKLVKTLSGTKRPHLPPRASSANLLRAATGFSEPDPEAQSEPPSAHEQTLVNRLLQSFLTHVVEDYVLTLNSEEDVPGLAWSSRLMEKYEPERIVPGKRQYADRFAEDEDMKSRSAIVGQIVALAQDLGMKTEELVQAIMDPEIEKQGIPGAEDEPPNSAEDIPLSKTGSLFLFAARSVKQELYSNVSVDDTPSICIFPDHATILANFVGVMGQQTVGLEPEALLDTVLALGLIALEKNAVGEPKDDEDFARYLQTTSLVSANTPSPSLRYHAHYLTSTILRSHPSDLVRLTFIRDTLEHCPYENLKASAVTWLKGETLEANPNIPHSANPATDDSNPPNIFATPVALSTVAPFLFPDLTHTYHSAVEISEPFMQFRQELGFYLAALNFYFLLLTARPLHDVLDIKGLHEGSNMEEHYLTPLKEAASNFKTSLEEGGELRIAEADGIGQAKMDIALLEEAIGMVERALSKLKGE
ncbi:DUF1760-domain-containing protein [Trematosphaeria pertusa]|uniref:DUF1760-domain-containing protein n=1 Tax=Trematosphaeria pertusa TaxID=390896 RepID=A0A6A6IM89_9PLEO|nr:DUF1760-domain-containing protein [Trematosphaeria pertusa]KAF2251198.1 DUF1760-domain-containing protein [Trematosphaeria pertusa]